MSTMFHELMLELMQQPPACSLGLVCGPFLPILHIPTRMNFPKWKYAQAILLPKILEDFPDDFK